MKHILKYSLGCLIVAATSMAMVSCSDDDESSDLYAAIYPKSVELIIPVEQHKYIYTEAETETKVLPMIKGESLAFTHIIAPDNITFKEVKWSSSNSNTVTVDQEGKVTAVSGDGVGYSIVQVAPTVFYSGSNIYSTLKISVSNSLVEAQSITVSSVESEVFAGETLQFTASILPEKATYKTVKWTTSNTDIAVIDEMTGLLTGKSTGVASAPVTVTATSLDGAQVIGTKEIVVKEIIQPQSMTIDQKHSVENGYYCAINEKTLKLEVTTVPADATQSLIQWTSSDESIATIKNGVVTFNNLYETDNINNPVPLFGDVTLTGTCPETNQSASIKINIAEGLMRELYHNQSHYTWYNAAQSGNETSSSHVWSYGKVTVTTYKQNATAQRGDFKCWSPRTYLHAGNYPIIAIRMDDVIDREDVSSRNITLDASGSCNGVAHSGGLNGNNNKWLHDYKCSDGSHVFIYDMATQGWANGGKLSTSAIATFPTLQFKYADIKNVTEQINYNVYWVQTFKSIDDVKTYIATEGLTYDIIK